MNLILPIAVTVLGVLAYAISANPKVVEIGRIAYFVGLFWTVFVALRTVVHF